MKAEIGIGIATVLVGLGSNYIYSPDVFFFVFLFVCFFSPEMSPLDSLANAQGFTEKLKVMFLTLSTVLLCVCLFIIVLLILFIP